MILALAIVLLLCRRPVANAVAGWAFPHETALAVLALIGAIVYGAAVLAPVGRRLMVLKP